MAKGAMAFYSRRKGSSGSSGMGASAETEAVRARGLEVVAHPTWKDQTVPEHWPLTTTMT